MTKRFMKKWSLIILIGFLALGLGASGCQVLPRGNGGSGSGNGSAVDSSGGDQVDTGTVDESVQPSWYQYPYGALKSAGTPDAFYLNLEWTLFKIFYVTSDGAGGSALRVYGGRPLSAVCPLHRGLVGRAERPEDHSRAAQGKAGEQDRKRQSL